jgi:8-oxo-dGTP diphosphatase
MEGRYTVYPRTLTFLLQGGDVLLIQRSPNARLFPGLFNGVGGHVERGENVLSAARREVHVAYFTWTKEPTAPGCLSSSS